MGWPGKKLNEFGMGGPRDMPEVGPDDGQTPTACTRGLAAVYRSSA